MFIKFNDTRVHAFPNVKNKMVTLRNKKTGKTRQVSKLDTKQSPEDIKWLRPGWNEFPREVWDQNKTHPSVKQMLKDGLIEVMNEKVEVKVGKKKIVKIIGQDDEEINLKDFSETRAIDIVKGTLNRDILERWMDEENRHKVKKALGKQIKPLLNENVEQKDEE